MGTSGLSAGASPVAVAALTGGRSLPSARFRIRQHVEPLRRFDIRVRDYPLLLDGLRLPGALGRIAPRYLAPLTAPLLAVNVAGRIADVLRSRRSDVIWINKQLIYGFHTLECRLKPARLLDVDDAVWLHGAGFEKTVRCVDAVVAGNDYLAEWLSRHCKRVHVVPTAIDTRRFSPGPVAGEANGFVLGWTGTTQTMEYLTEIQAPIAEFLRAHADSRLRVLCDRRPTLRGIPRERVDFVRWTPSNEAEVLKTFDVGLMPLRNTEWERGKCGFKMLQYMATGVPCCVSPVGMNAEIARMADVGFTPSRPDEWFEALEALRDDPSLRERQGRAGRALASQRFSVDVVAEKLARIIKNLAGTEG